MLEEIKIRTISNAYLFMKISSHRTPDFTLFKPSHLSLAIAVSLSFISNAAFAEDNQETSTQTLKTITVQAEGNWLEAANAEKVHKHAGARTIIDRKVVVMSHSIWVYVA